MRVFSEIGTLGESAGAIHLAIGVFDGVHIGHQKVIRRALQGAQQDGGSSIVVTFNPHPAAVLRPGGGPVLITPGTQLHEVLDSIGVDAVLEVKFDDEFAQIEAEDFVMALANACEGRLKRVSVGYDWRFGHRRAGDVGLLAKLGEREGFEVTAIPAVEVDGAVVRSTRVRSAVVEGRLEEAAALLGRGYRIVGEVVEGAGLGREIGFRTANVELLNELLPPHGVYAVRVSVDGAEIEGVANYGVRPTVDGGGGEAVFEAHLIDWEGSVYGKQVGVELVSRLRGEQRFEGVDALKEQIGRDVDAARAVLRG